MQCCSQCAMHACWDLGRHAVRQVGAVWFAALKASPCALHEQTLLAHPLVVSLQAALARPAMYAANWQRRLAGARGVRAKGGAQKEQGRGLGIAACSARVANSRKQGDRGRLERTGIVWHQASRGGGWHRGGSIMRGRLPHFMAGAARIRMNQRRGREDRMGQGIRQAGRLQVNSGAAW